MFRFAGFSLILTGALLASTAPAATQLSQAPRTQLASFGEGSYLHDSFTRSWLYSAHNGICTNSWWDFHGLNFGFTPMTSVVQELNVAEPSPWAANHSECGFDFELPFVGYVPESFRFSSIDPQLFNGGYSLTSLEEGSLDSAASPDEVSPEVTALSGSEAARELRRAWKSAMQRWPSKDVVLVLTAHWAHETHGGRSMFNYNFGGIKGHGPDGLSCIREAHEGSGYHVRSLVDRFRAYHDAKEGAEDYLSLLIRKYPQAIDAAERGDVTDFVSALKHGGYFTGGEAAYARSLSDLVQRAFELGFDSLSRLPASRWTK